MLSSGLPRLVLFRSCFKTSWKAGLRGQLHFQTAREYSRTGAVSSSLETALTWWLQVLTQGVTEHRPWTMPAGSPIRIYVDAASTPAHCAAVMVHAGSQRIAPPAIAPLCTYAIAGNIAYTNDDPAQRWLSRFGARQDNQIMSLVRNSASVACASAPAAVLAGTTRNRPGFGHLPPRGQRRESHCVQ